MLILIFENFFNSLQRQCEDKQLDQEELIQSFGTTPDEQHHIISNSVIKDTINEQGDIGLAESCCVPLVHSTCDLHNSDIMDESKIKLIVSDSLKNVFQDLNATITNKNRIEFCAYILLLLYVFCVGIFLGTTICFRLYAIELLEYLKVQPGCMSDWLEQLAVVYYLPLAFLLVFMVVAPVFFICKRLAWK